MATKRATIAAGKFKAQCLALLDRVARTHQELVITKRGRPVARVVALATSRPSGLKGSIRSDEDLVTPIAVRSTLLSQGFHGDPSDPLIVATAMVHGASLITRDERIAQFSGVQAIW